jgi:hypothetical protein
LNPYLPRIAVRRLYVSPIAWLIVTKQHKHFLKNIAMERKEGSPVFPNIIPDKMEISKFHIIENADIQTADDLNELILLMFNHPERSYYYFGKKEGPPNELLENSKCGGEMLMNVTEFFYYKHPNNDRDYIKIQRDGGRLDWEKEVVKKGPMFVRIKLELSEKKKRALEVYQKIEIEKRIDTNPIELKPNFMGFGIDLFKMFRMVKNWLGKRRKRGD